MPHSGARPSGSYPAALASVSLLFGLLSCISGAVLLIWCIGSLITGLPIGEDGSITLTMVGFFGAGMLVLVAGIVATVLGAHTGFKTRQHGDRIHARGLIGGIAGIAGILMTFACLVLMIMSLYADTGFFIQDAQKRKKYAELREHVMESPRPDLHG